MAEMRDAADLRKSRAVGEGKSDRREAILALTDSQLYSMPG
jgi:hypothetical protein